MPSIFHQSPGMAARGLSLIEQSVARQPNGLVNVTVKYAAPSTSVDQLLPKFTIDSAPPIYPDIINAQELQARRLYLQNFNAEKSAGLATITAQYAGALVSGILTPYQTNSFETGVLRVNSGAFGVPFSFAQSFAAQFNQQPNFADVYEFTYRARIAYYEIAFAPTNDAVTVEPPQLINRPGRDGLIVGWNISRSEFVGTPSDVPGFTFAPGYFRREWSAEQWLEFLMVELQKQQQPGLRPTVVTSTEVDNVTPTINIFKLRAKLFMPQYAVSV
jgi:hypothetical protein